MSNKKENISNFIKVFLLVFMMMMGFWISYCFVCHFVGLPLTNWTLWICFALAVASECGYYRWLRE